MPLVLISLGNQQNKWQLTHLRNFFSCLLVLGMWIHDPQLLSVGGVTLLEEQLVAAPCEKVQVWGACTRERNA